MYNLNDYVMVEIYAEGYYSSAIFETAFLITKEFYNKHKDKIDSFVFSVGDLDGKHSETDAITTIIENVTLNHLYTLKLLYDKASCAIDSLLSKLGVDSYTEIAALNCVILIDVQISKATTLTVTFQNESKMIGLE